MSPLRKALTRHLGAAPSLNSFPLDGRGVGVQVNCFDMSNNNNNNNHQRADEWPPRWTIGSKGLIGDPLSHPCFYPLSHKCQGLMDLAGRRSGLMASRREGGGEREAVRWYGGGVEPPPPGWRVASSRRQREVAGLLLTRLKEEGRRRGLGWTERQQNANTHERASRASSSSNDGWRKSAASPSPLLRRLALWMEWPRVMNIHVHLLNTEHINCQLYCANDATAASCSLPIDLLFTKLIFRPPVPGVIIISFLFFRARACVV